MRHQPLKRLLTNVATEMAELRSCVGALEHETSRLIHANDSSLSTSSIQMLQRFDSMSQTLEALSGFLADIGSEIEPTHDVDIKEAFEKLKVRALAERLAAEDARRAGTKDKVVALDAELF